MTTRAMIRLAVVLLAAIALVGIPFLDLPGLGVPGKITLGLFALAALFWMFEPVPIYATSLLVIFLQIVLLSKQGIVRSLNWAEFDAPAYTVFFNTLANPIIILFLGGFMLASAAVKFNLDKAVTSVVMRPFGDRPRWILLGLMIVTGLLSAFMSNTATTAMMMTVILPVLRSFPDGDRFRVALALSIPVAANIGGIATPIGTPPNAIAVGSLAEGGIQVAFSDWMLMAVPLTILLLIGSWLILALLHPTSLTSVKLDLSGGFNRSPKAIALYAIFGITVILWMTEALHGVGSSIIAFIPVAFLPLLGVIGKEEIRKLPWEVLWLVAGGLSIGLSMHETGLATWLVGIVNWHALGDFWLLTGFGFVTLIMANFLSHTVTATLIIPIAMGLAAGGGGAGFDPFLAVMVIAVASSLGMVLPISTPPNAIAMSTGLVTTPQMARVGLLVGIGGFVMTMIFAIFYWGLFR